MQIPSFFKKDFVKNVLTLLSGSALSQVIVYLAILWLTRLFSKEVFGLYMLFSSAILILKPITTLQLELAVLLPKKEKNAINIVVFSLLIQFILNIVILLIIISFQYKILVFFDIQKLGNFILLIPLGCFLFGCITTLNYWNNRQKLFSKIAKGNIVKASFLSSGQIATGLSSFSSIGMIPGMLLGQIAQLCYLTSNSFKYFLQLKKHISIKRMLLLFKQYKDIPLYNTLINFSNTLSNEIPVLMISKFFGLDFAGVYGLAIKVGRAPSGVFQDSISQVFFNKATETYNNKKNLHTIVKQTALHLSKISVGVFLVLFIISFFLDIVFGEKWSIIGLYLRILIPWLFVMFICSPLTSIITVLNQQKVILIYDLCLLICRFLSFYFGYYIFNSFIIAISLFSLTGVIFNCFILIYFLKISKTLHQNSTSYL